MHNKVIGSIGIPCIELINKYQRKYRIRWDYKDVLNENNEVIGVEYYETDIIDPTIESIKEIVISHYNKIIDEKILMGFKWNDMPIWLSTENQFNYKAAYDLAIQSQGQNLPIKFKFGSDELPVYHTFTTVDELQNFYISAMTYINHCLDEGWQIKDSIDWNKYNITNDTVKDSSNNIEENSIQ